MSCDVVQESDFTGKPKILIVLQRTHRGLHIPDNLRFTSLMNASVEQHSNKTNTPKNRTGGTSLQTVLQDLPLKTDICRGIKRYQEQLHKLMKRIPR